MSLELTEASKILRQDYGSAVRVALSRGPDFLDGILAELLERRIQDRIQRLGYGPQLSECMPAELHPSNTWWWLPEDPEPSCDHCGY